MSGQLVECATCGSPVSTSATRCAHCGEPDFIPRAFLESAARSAAESARERELQAAKEREARQRREVFYGSVNRLEGFLVLSAFVYYLYLLPVLTLLSTASEALAYAFVPLLNWITYALVLFAESMDGGGASAQRLLLHLAGWSIFGLFAFVFLNSVERRWRTRLDQRWNTPPP